jgi:hypothetical protein
MSHNALAFLAGIRKPERGQWSVPSAFAESWIFRRYKDLTLPIRIEA